MAFIKLFAVLFCMAVAGGVLWYLKTSLPKTKQELEKVNIAIASLGLVIGLLVISYKIITY